MVKVNLFDAKKSLERTLLLQAIIVMISILIAYKGAYLITHVIEQNLFINIIDGLLGLILVVGIHELLHFVLFKIFARDAKPQFIKRLCLITTQAPHVRFTKWQYILVMLTPLVLLTVLLFILFIFFPYSAIIFTASFHVGYSLLDVYFVAGAFNTKVKYIENVEESMIFYTAKDRNISSKS